jgi:hypothetical protein
MTQRLLFDALHQLPSDERLGALERIIPLTVVQQVLHQTGHAPASLHPPVRLVHRPSHLGLGPVLAATPPLSRLPAEQNIQRLLDTKRRMFPLA